MSCQPNTLSLGILLRSLFSDAQLWVTKRCGKGQGLRDLDDLDVKGLFFFFFNLDFKKAQKSSHCGSAETNLTRN